MSVGYLISEYPARSHTFIRREIEAIRNHDIDIDIFAVHRPDPSSLLSALERKDYDETWSVFPVEVKSLVWAHWKSMFCNPRKYFYTFWRSLTHRNPGAKNLLWSFFYFFEAIYLCQELKQRNVTHLHVHFANVGASVGRLCHFYLGLSWSMTLHGASDFEFPAGPLLSDKLQSASFANCASYYGLSQCYRVLDPNDWEKIFVSRCGIPYRDLPDSIEPSSEHDAPLKLYCVGRISSEKGHLGLLEALRICLEEGLSVELFLIGDGPDRPRLEQRIEELNLDPYIHLLGSQSEQEVLKMVRHADLFALPSFMEGIPLVLMEAMGLGVPVIAPRIAGIPELVIDHDTGLLFHPGDWRNMADCIMELAKDPDLANKLRNNARKKVAADFAIETAVLPLVEAFRGVGEIR